MTVFGGSVDVAIARCSRRGVHRGASRRRAARSSRSAGVAPQFSPMVMCGVRRPKHSLHGEAMAARADHKRRGRGCRLRPGNSAQVSCSRGADPSPATSELEDERIAGEAVPALEAPGVREPSPHSPRKPGMESPSATVSRHSPSDPRRMQVEQPCQGRQGGFVPLRPASRSGAGQVGRAVPPAVGEAWSMRGDRSI